MNNIDMIFHKTTEAAKLLAEIKRLKEEKKFFYEWGYRVGVDELVVTIGQDTFFVYPKSNPESEKQISEIIKETLDELNDKLTSVLISSYLKLMKEINNLQS